MRRGHKVIFPGERFGRLLTISIGSPSKNNNYRWLCRCDCGAERTVLASSLRRGHTRSCGCLSNGPTSERPTTHGFCAKGRTHALYYVWSSMKARCNKPSSKNYNRYGGRGIAICEEWIDFESFKNWSFDSGYKTGLTIDRINNNGNYEPCNCRWTTRGIQSRNNSRNRLLTINGESKLMCDWEISSGLHRSTIESRVKNGFPEEMWLSKKRLLKRKLKTL